MTSAVRRVACAIAACLSITLATFVAPDHSQAQETTPPSNAAPAETSDVVSQGKYLATAADCIACHTRDGGTPFAGGRVLETPFGNVLSANLTPDRATGLGTWTTDQFYRALHEGINAKGKHLYPAFPYNYFTHISRADSDAIYAYLMTLTPVANSPDRNQLPFPFNIRAGLIVWNALFLDKSAFASAQPTDELKRGDYLVNVLEHCGGCHTPKNVFGAPRSGHYLQGGTFAELFAPDLTSNARTGLGSWSEDDIVAFLSTGRNSHSNAGAEMGEVVTDSTSHLTRADLYAIARYLKTQTASQTASSSLPPADIMHRGEAIFVDVCSACHQENAQGIPELFPPLAHNANVQQSDPTTLIHFVLAGARTGPTDLRPTPFSMPSFAWKLTDDEIAAVVTYIRNSWGNMGPQVTSSQVAKMRKKLQQQTTADLQPIVLVP